MNVAILFSGQFRTLEQTAPTWREILRGTDVYLHTTPPDDPQQGAAWLGVPRERCWTLSEPAVIPPAPPGLVCLRPETKVPDCMAALWKLTRSFAMVPNPERYDLLVRARYDHEVCVRPEPWTWFDPAKLTVPYWCNWFGVQDQFVVGGPAVMRRFYARMDDLPAYVRHRPYHPEVFTADFLAQHGIPVARTNFLANRLRLNGERDGPCWATAFRDVPPHSILA